jgi:hypothetical protein
MRIALAAVPVLLLLGKGCAEKVPEPTAADHALAAAGQKPVPATMPLGCTIHGKPSIELGKAPKITVAITNQTNVDIYLVGSLDASDCKWRFPHCYFEVTGPDGKSAAQGIGRFCGNMNTLREKDFVKVPPGSEFDPYQHIDEGGFFSAHQLDACTFRSAGEFRIQFVYCTANDSITKWGGDGRSWVAADEKLVGLFKKVPKVEVRSNEIKVTVVEPDKHGPRR